MGVDGRQHGSVAFPGWREVCRAESGLAGTMQLDRSCLLDLLAQILRRSLVTGLELARASLTPRLAQASASQSLPSQLNRSGLAKRDVRRAGWVVEEAPAGCLEQLVDADACGGFLHGGWDGSWMGGTTMRSWPGTHRLGSTAMKGNRSGRGPRGWGALGARPSPAAAGRGKGMRGAPGDGRGPRGWGAWERGRPRPHLDALPVCRPRALTRRLEPAGWKTRPPLLPDPEWACVASRTHGIFPDAPEIVAHASSFSPGASEFCPRAAEKDSRAREFCPDTREFDSRAREILPDTSD